jgi:purine-binding chemotaxis protein CheW
MKNTSISSKSPILNQSNTRNAVASLKLVVFEMGNLNLALRIETVYKVLNHVPVYGTGINGVRIAHVGDRSVTVVELHRRFFAPKGSYLILVQNSFGELYGIPVVSVPVLREVPLSSIQVLPESYLHADLLGIATHVCHIPQAEESLTIFLLDVEQLLPSS